MSVRPSTVDESLDRRPTRPPIPAFDCATPIGTALGAPAWTMADSSTTGLQPPTATKPAAPHRVHSSCDRCRSRKTKAVPGPCRYCARTGAVCRIATPRRKRPYYHVTEEEYQCAMRILENFFPDRELNLHSLRAIAKEVTEGTLVAPTPRPTQLASPAHEYSIKEEEGPQETESVVESVNELHEPLGCLMRDSQGKYRYIGAHSEIPFNSAVCAIGNQKPKGSSIISPPKIGAYPPALTPTTSLEEPVPAQERHYLPPREICDYYVSRFLEQVHCTHWFYSIESLLSRVERTYSEYTFDITSSWLCSLYAIFAVGATGYKEERMRMQSLGASPLPLDEKSHEDYISLAKKLIPNIYDEADLDSIRALAILSIALENICSRVTSYLYIGASIQMAYSLGMHRDQLPASYTSIDCEQYRRVWWTLFTLEQEVSSRGGSPPLVDERIMKIDTPLPSEQVLYPGMHTPLSWLSTWVSLCRLKREIIQAVYPERSTKQRAISVSTISSLLLSLHNWLTLMPPHLKPDVPVSPTHKRAVSVLHLHYWGSIILLTRPFLLCLVLRHSELSGDKKLWFERMGRTCIDAAQKSLGVMQQMATADVLSSATALDSTCILRMIMIFILAFGHTRLAHYRANIDESLHLLTRMHHVGFCKMVAEETPIRLVELGIPSSAQANGLDNGVAHMWANLDPHFMTPLQSQQSLDLACDDMSAFELSSELLQFTSLDESIVLDPSGGYAGFEHFRGM
ncbi:hypothetical protein M011DRAFT_510361 [Sporormia fimetaria CBS 119925]|uniref:Xylanolytic transcriptional activator regulatory domain-containing protein n=1 Tax=Sporormia fimetaria CBS 119925 TaxID=1340428 RepID=A0A6A6V029_9PLEO|nr:hypothetical protein M011DRAFT_510361 [Sporormia fimetaria CBS 119925]